MLNAKIVKIKELPACAGLNCNCNDSIKDYPYDGFFKQTQFRIHGILGKRLFFECASCRQIWEVKNDTMSLKKANKEMNKLLKKKVI